MTEYRKTWLLERAAWRAYEESIAADYQSSGRGSGAKYVEPSPQSRKLGADWRARRLSLRANLRKTAN